MAYCSLNDIEKILAQALTTASPSAVLTGLPGKLTSIGRKLNIGLVTEDDANFYIKLAQSQIDAALSQQYVVPLLEIAGPQMTLLADINEYSDTIQLDKAPALNVGDVLYFTDGTQNERHEVLSIEGDVVTTREVVNGLYIAVNTRVLRLSLPDPIPTIAARLAAATIYDKYATAQQEPGKTEFGKALREDAIAELNNIREGRTILRGVQRIGWRFANPNLLDRYTVKGAFEQDSTRTDQRRG